VEKLEKPDLELNMNLILIFSFIWSIGGNLYDGMPWNSRQKYSQFIKSKILKVFKNFIINKRFTHLSHLKVIFMIILSILKEENLKLGMMLFLISFLINQFHFLIF
jgi:hypothetical protein